MNAKELRDLFASGRAYVACDGERLIDEATAREADAIAARALRLLAAAEGGEGTPETDACADWNARCERVGDNEIITHGLMLALAHDEGDELRLLARRLERERNGLAARVAELEKALQPAWAALAKIDANPNDMETRKHAEVAAFYAVQRAARSK